ncbi:MAG: MerR family transcriptional regulator [Anaerolineae bacterium]|nr:MerR family transcriptional regulator [Anaerolineae bacterium]
MDQLTDDLLTIQQVADKTGLSTHTLRYYEKIGLIQAVDRADNGHRRYSPGDVGWLDFLKCLRSTGMPVREVKRYAELYEDGDQTLAERRALLETHRARIEADLRELTANLEAIKYKIAYYRELEARATGGEAETLSAVSN